MADFGPEDATGRVLVRLNEALIAERDTRSTWVVTDTAESAFVHLPFMPRPDGRLPTNPSAIDASAEPDDTVKPTSKNPGYLGAQACAECHRDKHDGFVHTSHHRTSRPIGDGTLEGPFEEPENQLHVDASDLRYTLVRKAGKPYQRVSFGGWESDFPMDIVTGSSKSGQTYLYWHGDALFQNHVSFLTPADEWIPSPGFPSQGGIFSRTIQLGCLECHITYIDLRSPPNHFEPASAIWGISCERCHGPGAEHVRYHRQHPEQQEAKHVIRPSELPRERQLDICGQCHSGTFRLLSKAFSYRPGDDLAEHHKVKEAPIDRVGGVHTANQLNRLQKSECFRQSEMTCASCHDPHQYERGDFQRFSQRCLDCHQQTQCGMHETLGDRLKSNCISCHMPTGDNEGMGLDTSAGRFVPPMIDHFIRVDRDSTDAYLKSRQAHLRSR